jgi:hypothetical protein
MRERHGDSARPYTTDALGHPFSRLTHDSAEYLVFLRKGSSGAWRCGTFRRECGFAARDATGLTLTPYDLVGNCLQL